jgi:hypothetical protein
MKNSGFKIMVFFIALFVFSIGFSQDNLKAKIIAESADNLIDIKALAINMDITFKDEYTYLLFSLKKGKQGNYSKNSQSGTFSLQANETKELSSLKINIQNDEELKVFLFIRKFGSLISKDSLAIYATEKREKKITKETDFTLKGIVVNNAITKIGKDFHDYFYQAYSSSGQKYPFIITIDEKPYFGRSSIITIMVDEMKITEFYSKPSEDYLKSNVKVALQRLSSFSKQRKMLFKNSRI